MIEGSALLMSSNKEPFFPGFLQDSSDLAFHDIIESKSFVFYGFNFWGFYISKTTVLST